MPRLCNLERTRGFFRLCFFFLFFFLLLLLAGTLFPTFEFLCVCVCLFQSWHFSHLFCFHLSAAVFLSLFACQSVSRAPPSPSVTISVFIFRRSYQGLPSSRIPGCQFTLAEAERAPLKVGPLRGDQLGVSVTLESLLLMLQACRSAFGLVSAVYSCTCTHTCTFSPSLSLSFSLFLYTHTHTHGPYVPASPVTGPQYRSIIYLRPLTLWIRSRFSPIMAGLAQHPASIKAYPEMSPTHTHAQVRIMWSHSHPDVVTQTAKMARALLKKTHTHTHTCWI